MATGGTIQYGIKFNVDNSSLNQLKKDLQEIQNITTSQYQQMAPNASKNTKEALQELKTIKQAAGEVQAVLEKSFNINLGTANIKQVKAELAKMDIQKLYNEMSKLGDAGVRSFRNLASTILTTNQQFQQTNKILDKMAESFGNTVRWGITSSIWNNITGSIQKAWQYSKNLDSSLNDIRVVTGQSADQMDRLAKNANKTAQALGNTTLDYTKAALIYYQQGLSDAEVKARTDVTLKLANVLNTSAKDVSDYMTAIWNNFDHGSESLEHYADVITALGAATASSSEEIATGLQKFSAVANTVGLSYEYATAALATVVAQTRQSADTVGTAFKTLFARIQDLELGNTLDDGTTLGQYAEALQKVGINIKDSNGQLKNMDSILGEMGNKWKTLTKDQQVALAQNVAGTRQYTQLVALMDNWDKFGVNLQVAANSAGTLEKQQEIYLQSTEAHINGLTAAVERFMDALIDNKSINSLIDGLTKIVNLVSVFTESIGGGGNLLLLLGTIGEKVFSTQINKGLINANGQLQQMVINTKLAATQEEVLSKFSNVSDPVVSAVTKVFEQFKDVKDFLNEELTSAISDLADKAGKVQQKLLDIQQINDKGYEAYTKLASGNPELAGTRFSSRPKEGKTYARSVFENFEKDGEIGQEKLANAKDNVQKLSALLDQIEDKYAKLKRDALSVDLPLGDEESRKQISERLKHQAYSLKSDIYSVLEQGQEFIKAEDAQKLKNVVGAMTYGNWIRDQKDVGRQRVNLGTVQRIDKINDLLDKDATNMFGNLRQGLHDIAVYADNVEQHIESDAEKAAKEVQKNAEATKKSLLDSETQKHFLDLVTGISQVGMSFSSLSHVANIWKDNTISATEKVTQTLINVGTSIPMLINGFQTIHKNISSLIPMLKKLGTAVWESFGPFGVIVGAAVLAITGLVFAYNKWIDKEDQLQQQLERTKKTVAETTQAYSELNSALSNYQSAKAGLEGLTQGTIEFYSQIVKANEEARKLIDSLHLMAGTDYTIGDNGLITFDETKLSSAMFKEQQKIYQSQAAYLNAQIKMTEYNRDKVVRNAQRAVNLKNGDRVGFSLNQMESLLNGTLNDQMVDNKVTLENSIFMNRVDDLGDYFKNLFDLSKQERDKTAEGIFNIDKEVALFQGQYNEKTAQILAYQKQMADAVIRGFGSEADIKWYDEQNSNTREVIGQNVALRNTKNIINAQNRMNNDWEEFWDTTDDDWGKAIGKGMLAWIVDIATNNASAFIPGIDFGTHTVTELAGNENKLTNQQIKEYYAQMNGATKVGDSWVYGNGEQVDFSKINLDVAKDAYYSSGGYLAQGELTKIIQDFNNNIDIVKKRGFDETEAKNIAEALLAIEGGSSNEYNWGALTDREFEEVQFQNMAKMRGQAGQAYVDWWKGTEDHGDQAEMEFLLNYYKEVNTEYYAYLQSMQEAIVLRSQLTEEEKEAIHLANDLKEYNEAMSRYATELGTSEEALKVYDAALQNAKTGTIEYNEELAKTAASTYKFNKAYNEGRSTFKKNEDAFNTYIEALKNGEEVSYDVADATGEILKSLKAMGLTIDTTDLKDTNYLEQVKTLLTGTKEEAEKAYKALQRLSWAKVLANDFKIASDNIDTVLDKLEDLNDKEQISLGDLGLGELKGTAEQISEELGKLGIEISPADVNKAIEEANKIKKAASNENVNVTDLTSQGTTKKTVKIESTNPDEKGALDGTYTWTESTTSDTPVVTLGKNTKFNFTKTKVNVSTTASKDTTTSKSKKSSKTKGEADRYHEVNTQITKINNNLTKLEKQANKVFGSKLVKNLNNEISLLNKQIKNYDKYLEIAKNELKEVQNNLKKTKLGVKFNDDGTIANYVETYNKALKQLNAAEAAYEKNKSTANEKKVERLNEQFENIQKWMNRNDAIISDEILNKQQLRQDALDKIIEDQVQKIKVKIDLAVEFEDIRINWNDFKAKIVNGLKDKDILGNIALDKLQLPILAEEAGYQANYLNEIFTEARKLLVNKDTTGKFGDNEALAKQTLLDAYNDGMDIYTKYAETREKREGYYLNALQQEDEALQDQYSLYEQIETRLSHDIKLLQLVYGDKAYDKLEKYNKLQEENNRALLKDKTKAAEAAEKEYKLMEEMYAKGLVSEEMYKAARDRWFATTNDKMEQLATNIETFQEHLKTTAEKIAKTFSEEITNAAGGLDFAREEWELVNKNANLYLDTINRLSGEKQLESKYLESIEKATSPAIQKKLKDAMDSEMKALREKDKLSQYDLDRANKKYQLTLAQIALEEAQDNKSTMRLRRDSQGNYRYQYVADEDNIKKAEEDLQKAYDDLYNFDKARFLEVTAEIETEYSNYRKRLLEIETDTNLSPEERMEKEKLITEQYMGEDGIITKLREQAATAQANVMESAFNDLAHLYNEDVNKYWSMTEEEQKAIMTGLIPAWDTVISRMITANGYMESMIAYAQQLSDNLADYESKVGQENNIANINLDDLENGQDQHIADVQEMIGSIDQILSKQNQITTEARNTYLELEKLPAPVDALNEGLTKTNELLTDLEKKELKNLGFSADPNASKITEAIQEGSNAANALASVAANITKPTFTSTISKPKKGNNINENSIFKQFLVDAGYKTSSVTWKKAIQIFQELIGTKADGIAGPNTWEAAKAKGYNTGGYTGTWNDNNGRLAFLHQKELVLNSEDTKNILEAVYAMRKAMLSARINSIISSGIAPLGGDTLEQNVHIEATFPNVTTAYEIEEALRNLVNAAAQRRRNIN